MLILCVVRLWVCENIVSCWYVQCSGKETKCDNCGQRGCGEGLWRGSVQLRGAVHDVENTDNIYEGLCWVVHDDVVDGCLLSRCCVCLGMEHKRGKSLLKVGPGGDCSFESCRVMRRLVERVTLLAVDIVALCGTSGSM